LTKTPTPTEKLSLTPTPDAFGDVLGATEAGSSDFSENETSNEYEKDSDLKPPVLWPKLLIGLGLMLIFGAAYPLWLPKLKIVYNRIKRNK